MRQRPIRLVAAFAALAVLAAACGSDRKGATTTVAPATTATTATTAAPAGTEAATTVAASGSTPGTTSGSGATGASTASSGTDANATTTAATDAATTTTVSNLPMFGDAPWPCGPGSGANTDDGTEVGVTKDSITLATGDDAGYTGAPGLNHEMGDAMKAVVSACNDLGGINGRKINLNYYDAAVFNVTVAMQSACDAKSFFLVGEGWSFDSNQEETRLGCGLPAVPGYSVSAAFSNGKDVFQPVPNPADEAPGSEYAQMVVQFPDAIKHVGALAANYSATQESRDKVVSASPAYGWQFATSTLEYNVVGEADWTPFVKQLQAAGAQLVSWTGTCLPHLQLFEQAAKANGYNVPVIADANHYQAECAAANTDGAMNDTYMRMVFIPFEEASQNKATQDYLDLMKAKGGDVALLGAQSVSAFLLWATAASACGDSLTRACTLANLKNIHDWTGHGLQAKADVGNNQVPACGMLLRLEGTKYERVAPTEPGTFACDPSWVGKVTGTPALIAAKLDADRISQEYAPAG
ncbi:MAG: Branched-chain amino acid transporter substrate-binding protein [Ilumatobacteraceae bacterium]|nr:Branched-chain amino acid transporter substrate-binding protein [Ilumatobacteraceae bacterium]